MQKCLSSLSSFPGLFLRTEKSSEFSSVFKFIPPLLGIISYCCKQINMITKGMFVSKDYNPPLAFKTTSARVSLQVFAKKIHSTI